MDPRLLRAWLDAAQGVPLPPELRAAAAPHNLADCWVAPRPALPPHGGPTHIKSCSPSPPHTGQVTTELLYELELLAYIR